MKKYNKYAPPCTSACTRGESPVVSSATSFSSSASLRELLYLRNLRTIRRKEIFHSIKTVIMTNY